MVLLSTVSLHALIGAHKLNPPLRQGLPLNGLSQSGLGKQSCEARNPLASVRFPGACLSGRDTSAGTLAWRWWQRSLRGQALYAPATTDEKGARDAPVSNLSAGWLL
jgi:hypothetical protein